MITTNTNDYNSKHTILQPQIQLLQILNMTNIQNIEGITPEAKIVDTFTTIRKNIISVKALLTMEMIDFLARNKNNYNQVKQQIEKCEKDFQVNLLLCLCLSGALALSLRRYLPTFYFSLNAKTITFDCMILLTGFIYGSRYASNKVQDKLGPIMSELVKKKDEQALNKIVQFSQQFGVSSKHIADIIAMNNRFLNEDLTIILENYAHSHANKSRLIV